ncbi:MAG: hypothetical protein QM784_26855 [Polyangiaceae bacterium]
MKSVGEAMSIGRTFAEALQKAARSLETGKDGLVSLLDRVEYRALDFNPSTSAISSTKRRPWRNLRPKLPQATNEELLAALRRLSVSGPPSACSTSSMPCDSG